MQEHDEFAPCDGLAKSNFACVSDVPDQIEIDTQ
jgi:hypothetical protein